MLFLFLLPSRSNICIFYVYVQNFQITLTTKLLLPANQILDFFMKNSLNKN